MSCTYAVLFKTHYWDEFTRRQLDRLREVSGNADIYVVMDETMKPGPDVPGETVLRITTQDLNDLQLPLYTTHGSVIWYNSDYPNYIARERLPAYDYYVAMEYDAVFYGSLDKVVNAIARDGADYVGWELQTPPREWPWFDMHREMYGENMMKYMSSVCIVSHRALGQLLKRRQEQGAEFAEGKLPCWPMLEVFVPYEVQAAGMCIAEIGDYMDTTHHNWWPPTEEATLPDTLATAALYHPVLHGTRFVRSMLHHEPSLKKLLLPWSAPRKRLASFDQALVRRIVREEVTRRISDKLVREFSRLGLRKKWYADVMHGSQRSRQRPSVHNAA